MKRGEALLILGSIAHGGGANNAESNRVLHSVFLCRAYLRPEVSENAIKTHYEDF